MSMFSESYNTLNDKYESDFKLEVLQVHNWGLFQHPDPVVLRRNNVFFGNNGSGKTMSIDALTFLLYGNNRFNVSSDAKAGNGEKRNVLSMILGTINSQEQRTLRPVGTISYILVQGYDSLEKHHFVLGVCLESVDDRYNSYRFVLRDTKLEQVHYYERGEEDTIIMLPHNKIRVIDPEHPVKLGEKISFYTDVTTGVKQFMSVLGMTRTTKEQVVGLINQVLSYNDKTDLQQFIRVNLLPERNLVKALRDIQDQQTKHAEQIGLLDSLVEKKNAIGEILEEHKKYLEVSQKLVRAQLTNLYSDYRQAEKKQAAKKAELEDIQRNLQDTQDRIPALKKAAENAQFEYYRSKDKLDEDVTSSIEQLEQAIKAITDEITKAEENMSRLVNAAVAIQEAMGDWDLDDHAKKIYEMSKKIGLNVLTPVQVHEIFDFARDWKKRKLLESSRESSTLGLECDQIRKEISENTAKLEYMRNFNSIQYDDRYIRAKEKIEEEMVKSGVRKADIFVRLLAETVDNIDPKWQRAIETYLGDRRFHVIVPDKYNMFAYDVIRKNRIYNVSVPYDGKFIRKGNKPVVMPNSAASMLEISNREAREYADYLLGRVKLCENDEEMRQALSEGYNGAITMKGDVARASARRLTDLNGKNVRLYIGSEAVQREIERLEAESNELHQKLSDKTAQMNKANAKHEHLESMPTSDVMAIDYQAESAVSQCETQKARYEANLQILKDSNKSVLLLIQEAELYSKKCDNEYNSARDRIAVYEHDIQRLTDELDECGRITAEAKKAYDEREFQLNNPRLSEGVVAWYEKKSQKEDRPYINIGSIENNINSILDVLKQKQNDFRYRFGLAGNTDLVGLGGIKTYYQKTYNELVTTDIERMKTNITRIEEQLTDTFCTGFIIQTMNNIEEGKKIVYRINRFLSGKAFGGQTYRVECAERTDDVFGDFQAILEALRIIPGLNSYNFDMNDQNVKDQLFRFISKIMEDENINFYSDYRNYMTADISIEETLRDGSKRHYLFSTKKASSSNGEKITPFLIIMVISMYAILKDNKNGYRAFFMDEAFSVYSADRIKQMMQLLESLGFQCFFAAPDTKSAHYMNDVALINTYKPNGSEYSVYIDAHENGVA